MKFITHRHLAGWLHSIAPNDAVALCFFLSLFFFFLLKISKSRTLLTLKTCICNSFVTFFSNVYAFKIGRASRQFLALGTSSTKMLPELSCT